MMNALQCRLGSKCTRLYGNNVRNILRHHFSHKNLTFLYLSTNDRLNCLNNVRFSGSSSKWLQSRHTSKSPNHRLSKSHTFTPLFFESTAQFNHGQGITATGSRHLCNVCHNRDEQINRHEEYQKSLDDLAKYLNQSKLNSSECQNLVLDLKEIFFKETLSNKKWILNRLELPNDYRGLSSVLACVQGVVLPEEVAEKLNQAVRILSERRDELEPKDAIHIASNFLLLGCNVNSPEMSKLLEKAFCPKNRLNLHLVSIGLQMFPEAVPEEHVRKLLLECSEKDYQFDNDSDVIHFFKVFNHAYQTNQSIHQSTFDVLTRISENPTLMSNVDTISKLLHLTSCMKLSPRLDKLSQDENDWLYNIAIKSYKSIIEHKDKTLSLVQSFFVNDGIKSWQGIGTREASMEKFLNTVDSMTALNIKTLSLDEVVLLYRYKNKYFYRNQEECQTILLRDWQNMDAWLLQILLDIVPAFESPDLFDCIYQQMMESDHMSVQQSITVMKFLHTSNSPQARKIMVKAYRCLLKSFRSEKLRLSVQDWSNLISGLPYKKMHSMIWENLFQTMDSCNSQQLVEYYPVISAVKTMFTTKFQDMQLGQQVLSLSNYLETRVLNGLEKVNDIQMLCRFITAMYYKRTRFEIVSVPDMQNLATCINRVADLYLSFSSKQRYLHFMDVCKTLCRMNFHAPEIIENLSVDITKFEDCSLDHVFHFVKLLGIFWYTPRNLQDVTTTVERSLDGKFEQHSLGFQLNFMKHMNKANIFPEKQMKGIFSVEFMNKVSAANPDLKYVFIKLLCALNQYAVSDCPHFNIPWLDLHEKFLKPVAQTNHELMMQVAKSRRDYKQVYISLGEDFKEDESDKFVDFFITRMAESGYVSSRPVPLKNLLHAHSMTLTFSKDEEVETAMRFHKSYYKGVSMSVSRSDGHIHKYPKKSRGEVFGILMQLAGEECVAVNPVVPYAHRVDFMLYLNKDGNFVKIADVDDTVDSSRYERLAFIVAHVIFPVNMKIKYNNRVTRHLSKMGYTVIVIDINIWNSMALSKRVDKLNYLKELIFSSNKNTAYPVYPSRHI